jgi:TPP-dependent indolepyruvate ferredoxin oxidoreductase alpha subunit
MLQLRTEAQSEYNRIIEWYNIALMKSETEKPEIDMSLVHEFEYRKKKIQVIEEGKQCINRVREALAEQTDIDVVRETALIFAQSGIDLAIENIDTAIQAFTSVRKYNSAISAMKFLLLLLVLSNILTGVMMWLILR